MLEILRGSGLAVLIAIAVLAGAAALISGGLLGQYERQTAAAACVIGALIGGVVAARRCGHAVVPAGLGVGCAQFLLLLTVGVLAFNARPGAGEMGVVFGCCLCGGLLAGLLSGKKRKRTHRKR